MNLELKKPVIFFDLEATGLNIAQDRIVEIGIVKVYPSGKKETYVKKVNPTIPIPLEVSEIHGIYDIDIINEPTFKEIGQELIDFIANSDLAGYNSNRFDIPLLLEEFYRAGFEFDMEGRKAVDVQNVFYKMEQRTLSAAYQFYCQKEIENAHSAEADILATVEVLDAQLERYSELENNIDFLSEFTHMGAKTLDFAQRIALDDNNNPTVNFGKHKGKLVTEVFKQEPGYYGWLMNADFSFETKKHFTTIWKSLKGE